MSKKDISKKSLLGLIIVLAIFLIGDLIGVFSCWSPSRFDVLKSCEEFIQNGREVTGKVTDAKELYEWNSNTASTYNYYLYYEYEENGQKWSMRERVITGKSNYEPVIGLLYECQCKIGSNVQLFIGDNGKCVKAGEEQHSYKSAYNSIYVTGSITTAIAGVLIICLTVALIFYFKPTEKKERCKFI